MAGFLLLRLFIIIVCLVLYLVPAVKILHKAGYGGWWCLFLLIPLVNIIMIYVFAFADWPALRDRTG